MFGQEQHGLIVPYTLNSAVAVAMYSLLSCMAPQFDMLCQLVPRMETYQRFGTTQADKHDTYK